MIDFDEVIKSWKAKGWTAEDVGRDVWDYQQESINELEAEMQALQANAKITNDLLIAASDAYIKELETKVYELEQIAYDPM